MATINDVSRGAGYTDISQRVVYFPTALEDHAS